MSKRLTPALVRERAVLWARRADTAVVLFLIVFGFESLAFLMGRFLPHVAGPTGNPLYIGYLILYAVITVALGLPMTVCAYRAAYWGQLYGTYPIDPAAEKQHRRRQRIQQPK